MSEPDPLAALWPPVWFLRSRGAARHLLVSASALLLWCFMGQALSADACEGNYKRALILYSQRSDFGFSTASAETFVQSLRDGLNGCLEDDSEYIDAARIGESNYFSILREFLARKYQGVRFDLLITLQRPALSFVKQSGEELFPGTPVFFIAGKGLEDGYENPGPNFAGALFKVDLRRTVDAMLSIQPALKQIVVVSGGSQFDINYESGAREQFQGYRNRLRFTYLSGLPIEELEQRIGQLPSDSAIYLMSMTADRLGNRFVRTNVTERIAAASSVPVYSAHGAFMDHGILGGSLVSVDRVLGDAAPLPLRLLRGASIESVGISEFDPHTLMFDWRQLKRWGIAERRLPAGSVVRFREPGIWEEHRSGVLVVFGVFALQVGFISALLVERSRRRDAERAARDFAGRLLTAEESERTRIARDLHDGICQEVASMAADASLLQGTESPLDLDARQMLGSFQDRARGIAESLRILSHQLHPTALQHVGLVAALAAYCIDVERQHRVRTMFFSEGPVDPLDSSVATSLFRISQEALRNTVRHAAARNATVSLVRNDAGLQLVIADDGVGFDVTAVRSNGGLGLVSIEERVRLLDGRVVFRPTAGGGTTIDVRVPAALGGAKAAEASATLDRAEGLTPSANRATVLLAEDHADLAARMTRMLGDRFDVVDVVGDGHALLAAVRREEPDVIVTDISMPGLNGLAAIRQLRTRGHRSKVIVLTMHADASLAAEALRAGASGFVLKYQSNQELADAVDTVLRGETYLSAALQPSVLAIESAVRSGDA